jgi:hypothetical protein
MFLYSFEKFVDWRQCPAVMQREAVTVMPSCSGEGNVVRIWVTVVLRESFLGYRSNYVLSGPSALRDWILCSAWKKWIRNPTTHPSCHTVQISPHAISALFQPWKGSSEAINFVVIKRSKSPVPLSSWSLRQTVCSTFSRSGWSTVKVHRLRREILRKRNLHRTSTKFRLGIISWVHELFKRPS